MSKPRPFANAVPLQTKKSVTKSPPNLMNEKLGRFSTNDCQDEQLSLFSSPWLTATEAALYLRISIKTLYNWKSQGKIRAHSIRGSSRGGLRFLKEDLDKVLK